MGQMQTSPIRTPAEDFQVCQGLLEDSAQTPSEKLRALLARVRRHEAGPDATAAHGAWKHELVQPLADTIAALERWDEKHSQITPGLADQAPQSTASLAAKRARQEAVDIEAAALARQCFRLLMAMLRAAALMTPATRGHAVFDRDLPEIIELANIIATRH